MNSGFFKKNLPSPSEIPSDIFNRSNHSKINNQDDLPDMPIYFETWIKYFRYKSHSTTDKPKHFYKNNEFHNQIKGQNETSTTDNFGEIKIPTETSFFAILYRDSLDILSSRESPLRRVVDSIHFKLIKNIPDSFNFKGGVKDFGRYTEGFCFEVLTKIPNDGYFEMTADKPEPLLGTDENWIICTEDEAHKQKLMNGIIKLRLKLQHKVGFYYDLTEAKSNKPKKNVGDYLGPQTQEFSKNIKNQKDGQWILLKDWGECTLKCGGGLMYQQLMCIPPKEGGTPCEGPAIRTKPCNSDPCPVKDAPNVISFTPSKNGSGSNNSNGIKLMAPIIKVMPLSTRPTRYDKCYLKEGDALMLKQDKLSTGFSTLPKVPVRIVMNNKSLVAFQDETMSTNLGTFILSRSKFIKVVDQEGCFIIESNTRKAQFCKIDNGNGDFVNEWNYDFNLFKNQCKEKRPTIETTVHEEEKLAEEYNKKINEVKSSIDEEKQKIISGKVKETDKKKEQKEVDSMESMGLMAINKEVKLEEMIEREEQAREKQETTELELEVKEEKKKDECLLKAMKEKEIETQRNLSKTKSVSKIQNIKSETQSQIQLKRHALKMKILNMRKKTNRKKEALNEEIQLIRSKVANRIHDYSKKGDANNCFNPSIATTLNDVNIYCMKAFKDDIKQLMQCKTQENFCYICCENEFGDFHAKDRELCYDKCEGNSKKDPNSGLDKQGKWLWVNNN